MELKDKDSTESSKQSNSDDWGVMISRFMRVYPSMNLENILKLSYPQFKALYSNIYNEKTFQLVIPYMGSGESEKDEMNKIKNEATESNIIEIQSVVAQMNREFVR